MIQLSKALQLYLLENYGFKWLMEYGAIHVFSGDPPEAPNKATTGTLLGTISQDGLNFSVPGTTGHGLEMEVWSDATLRKKEEWKLKCTATGVAGWWRMRWRYDDPMTDSDWYPRLDGRIGEGLVLSNTNIVSGTSVPIQDFRLSMRGYANGL